MYRIKPGSVKYKLYAIPFTKYTIGFPITKWVFKQEPISNWIVFDINHFK